MKWSRTMALILIVMLLFSQTGCGLFTNAPSNIPDPSSLPAQESLLPESSLEASQASSSSNPEETSESIERTSFLWPSYRNRLVSPQWFQNRLIEEQDCGSAGALVGNVLVVNIFLSDAVSEWDDRSRSAALAMQQDGFAYLETYALCDYGVRSVHFEQTDVAQSFNMQFSLEVIDDPNEFRWTEQMLPENGYESFLEVLREAQLRMNKAYDHAVAVVHLNKEGRSYALPAVLDDQEDVDWGEHAVLYFDEDESHDYASCSGMYAHELLHLFGAIDLYFPDDADSTRADRMLELYPDEIMRQVSFNLGESTIDAITAFCIGWIDTLDEELAQYLTDESDADDTDFEDDAA